jgi:protein-tyrosine phosphatase
MDDSARCAGMLVDAGYTHAFCTPHVWPALPHNNIETIVRRVDELQAEYDRRGIPLRVLPGGELNILWGWPALGEVPDGRIISYGMAGRYVLFDFWAEELSDCITCMEPAVRHLQSHGLKLILAHPERIAALRDPIAVDWFVERGVLLQMNTWCLTDQPGTPTYDIAARLLVEGHYFLLGTDCHNAASMPNRIRGLEIAERLVGREILDRLTVGNPRGLIPPGAWEGYEPHANGRGAHTPAAQPLGSRARV